MQPTEEELALMKIVHELRKFLWKAGYDVSRFRPVSHPVARRMGMFKSYAIDLVLDIGANSGQFGDELRGDFGYRNRIVSFEPLSAAFEILKAKAAADPAWRVFHCAIGDAEERREINVAGNSLSSSLLDMLPSHVEVAPDSKYVGKEWIEVRTLDSIFSELREAAENVYMKIDTQGFEGRVLKGAEKSLPRIDTVQMEMSLVPLYDGELLYHEMGSLMSEKGYALVAVENAYADPASGRIMQIDGIFHRFQSE
jgi:FkbM family methyltransferase